MSGGGGFRVREGEEGAQRDQREAYRGGLTEGGLQREAYRGSVSDKEGKRRLHYCTQYLTIPNIIIMVYQADYDLYIYNIYMYLSMLGGGDQG